MCCNVPTCVLAEQKENIQLLMERTFNTVCMSGSPQITVLTLPSLSLSLCTLNKEFFMITFFSFGLNLCGKLKVRELDHDSGW